MTPTSFFCVCYSILRLGVKERASILMKKVLLTTLKWLSATSLALGLLVACGKEISVSQEIKNGVISQTINGKTLSCQIVNSTIHSGEDVVLICTNDTDYEASIEVSLDGKVVKTIEQFPYEYRHILMEPGLHQLSIRGTLGPKSFRTSFNYGWPISVID